MAFDFKTLSLFVRIANLGALGRAGAEFGLSPTSTTQRIQALEQEAGTKLLNRTTRAVSLTADGEVFLAHAKKILDDIEDARCAMSRASETVSGELRVTASASFGRSYIVPHVPEFLRLYPHINLRLNLSDAIVDIVEQGYDLAIRVGALAPSSLMARKLADNPRLLVASPDYLKEHSIPETPAALSQHNCITLGETHNWSLTGPNDQTHETRVSGCFSTNFGEAITEAVLGGLGIGLKSEWDVWKHLQSGRLVSVLSEYRIDPAWHIWAVRPPGRLIPARVSAFTEFMEQKFDQYGK